jgi:hypothetical protein
MLKGRILGVDTGIGLTPRQALQTAKLMTELDYFVQAKGWLDLEELKWSEKSKGFVKKILEFLMIRHDKEFVAKK